MKNIKDYLHLYFGCEMMKSDNSGRFTLNEITLFQMYEADGTSFIKNAKPILRSLSDMDNKEAEHFAWLCMDSKHHLEEDTRISKDEIYTELHHNDGGNLLDGDVEIYIEVTCRCFEGWVSIMKDGRIGVGEEDQPSSEMKPVDDVAEKIHYLLKQGFDLFGLIESGLAIDKRNFKTETV